MKIRCIPEQIPGPLPQGNCPACGRRRIPYLPRCLCGEVFDSAGDTIPDVLPGVKAPKETCTFRIAHWSDLHMSTGWSPGLDVVTRLRALLLALKKLEVDGLIISGDLTQSGKIDDLMNVRQLLDAHGFGPHRRLVVPGNHDIPHGTESTCFDEIFEVEYPLITEFGPGLQVIAFDSNAVEERTLFERRWVNVRGRVGKTAIDKVRLAKLPTPTGGRLLVLHHHLARLPPEKGWATLDARMFKIDQYLMAPLLDGEEVLAFANELEVTAVLHGHKHWYSRTGYRVGSIPVFNAGSVTRMLHPQFRIFDFDYDGWRALYRVEVTV